MIEIKEGLDVLPLIGNMIKYKDEDLDAFEKYDVLAVDVEEENIVVKHIFYHFGKTVSYVGISFSEYFKDMEIV